MDYIMYGIAIVLVLAVVYILKAKPERQNIKLFMIGLIMVLAGTVLPYLISLYGNEISGESDSGSVYFPWLVFLPIWIALINKKQNSENPLNKKLQIVLTILIALIIISMTLLMIIE